MNSTILKSIVFLVFSTTFLKLSAQLYQPEKLRWGNVGIGIYEEGEGKKTNLTLGINSINENWTMQKFRYMYSQRIQEDKERTYSFKQKTHHLDALIGKVIYNPKYQIYFLTGFGLELILEDLYEVTGPGSWLAGSSTTPSPAIPLEIGSQWTLNNRQTIGLNLYSHLDFFSFTSGFTINYGFGKLKWKHPNNLKPKSLKFKMIDSTY